MSLNAVNSMKTSFMLCLLLCAFATRSLVLQKASDWVTARDETAQLDPTDYHTGRVYRPGPDDGNIQVGIEAKQPVTIAMTEADDWNDALLHPQNMTNLTYRCVREHVVSTIYECHLPPDRPMVFVIHDERTPDRVLLTGIEAVLGQGVKQFASTNDVRITYKSWDCFQI